MFNQNFTPKYDRIYLFEYGTIIPIKIGRNVTANEIKRKKTA